MPVGDGDLGAVVVVSAGMTSATRLMVPSGAHTVLPTTPCLPRGAVLQLMISSDLDVEITLARTGWQSHG